MVGIRLVLRATPGAEAARRSHQSRLKPATLQRARVRFGACGARFTGLRCLSRAASAPGIAARPPQIPPRCQPRGRCGVKESRLPLLGGELRAHLKEGRMAYIITRLCRDCVDTACVAVCPVDCIYRYIGTDTETFPNQLYIHPDEWFDFGSSAPEW